MRNVFFVSLTFLLLMISKGAYSSDNPEPLPPLENPIIIKTWKVVGPFLSGSREGLINPLGTSFDYKTGRVNLKAKYPSIQAYGGEISWQTTTVNESGDLVVNFDQHAWEKIADEWGNSGIAFAAAAYTTIEVPQKCRASVNAQGIGTFYINGRRYSGDPYGHKIIQTPVILDKGENRILFFLGGYGGYDSAKFEILPPPKRDIIVLEKDILLPDLVRGEAGIFWAGIPILNTTDTWIYDVSVKIGGEPPFIAVNESYKYDIAPLAVLKIPVQLSLSGPLPQDWESDEVEIPVILRWGLRSYTVSVNARVRDTDDSRRITFLSGIDESVQKYSVLYPVNYNQSKQYSLILALHGAGVECDNLVDEFEPKEDAFIVAPTNRRKFGFDWQDWGRLDAMEVLSKCLEEYPIDDNRVYLIGHSMGGHGAWHIGCTHADKFAAIVPSAGWASFQLYTPWFLRTDEMFFDPVCESIFDAAINSDRTERLLDNLINTPVLAVHGGDDDNVPPTHGRLLSGILKRMDFEVKYWEEANQGHWWDNDPNTPGTGCVDAPRIRSFISKYERNPYPRHIIISTADLGNVNRRFWLEILHEVSPLGHVFVDAKIGQDGILKISTHNVQQLIIHLSDDVFPFPPPRWIEIDNQRVDPESKLVNSICLINSNGFWYEGKDKVAGIRKTPEFRGPIKRAFYKPFIMVVGTSGTEEETQLNLEIARNYSQQWWYRANGLTRIISDREFTKAIDLKYANVILIGGPKSNMVSSQYQAQFPIRITDIGILLKERLIVGENLACQFVYPLDDDSLALAIWGTSPDGLRLAGSLSCLYSGSGVPDFIIFDDEVRFKGYAGVRAAGFFDNSWDYRPEFAYVR